MSTMEEYRKKPYRRVPAWMLAWWMLRSSLYLVVRPHLWSTARRFLAWPPWRCLPYLKFRYETMYGSYDVGSGHDVVVFLRWARGFGYG